MTHYAPLGCALFLLAGGCSPAPEDSDANAALTSPTTAADNVYGAVLAGTKPASGGLDGHGYALSSALLGSPKFAGTTFSIGASGTRNAVSSTTVPVTAGKYASVSLIGTGSNGSHTALPFVVTYSDGTKSTFSQSISDWGAPEDFSGETIVSTMADRITPAGVSQQGAWHLYGYTFPLNAGKTVESIELPPNRDVVFFGIGFTAPAVTGPAEPPAAVKAGYSKLAFDGTFTNTSKIDLNDTQAAGFDWYLTNPSWSRTVSPASKLSIVTNAGTPALKIDGTSNVNLYGALKSKTGVVGHQFTGGAYYEARIAMELPTVNTGAWPAFWAVTSLGNGTNYQWPGAPASYDNSVELDIMEFMPESETGAKYAEASFTAHDWYGIYGETCKQYCQTMSNGVVDAYSLKTKESSTLTLQTKPTDSAPTFHDYGVLVVPSVQNADGDWVEGYMQYFFDGVAQGDAKYVAGPLPDTAATSNDFTPTPTAAWTYLPIQLQPYGLILSSGGDAFMEVEYVRVWQK